MTPQPVVLKTRRRDDDMLRAALSYTSRYFGLAIIMPNLTPPITIIAQVIAYLERILV